MTTCHRANRAQAQLNLCASLLLILMQRNVDMQQKCHLHCPATTMPCLLS